jgi:type I restriction enzyme, S subunit
MSNIRQIGDIAMVVSGYAFAEVYQGRPDLQIPFFKVSDFANNNNSWLSKAVNTVDRNILNILRAKTYPPGTIVFPKVGGALLTNKRARLLIEATFDNNIMGLIPKKVNGDYLYCFMCLFDMTSIANTQSLPSVRITDVAKIKIPIPPIEKQHKIATLLKAQLVEVKKVHQAIKAQLQDAQTLKSAILKETFTNHESKKWPAIKLGEAGKVVAGITLGRKVNGKATRSIPYLRVANVKDGHLDLSDVKKIEATEAEIERLLLKPGDILLTEGGDPDKLGRGTFWSGELDECIHQNHIFRVRFPHDSYLPEFIAAQIGSSYGKDYFFIHAKQTTGIATINQKILKNFPVLSPPLETQKTVMTVLSGQLDEVEKMTVSLKKQLDDINLLPQKILAQAFEIEP